MNKELELKGLNLLFQRPLEPIFKSKDNGKSIFILPEQYYPDRYKVVASELQDRFNLDVDIEIQLPEITPPDISFATALSKKTEFSLFNETHSGIAAKLIELFMNATDRSNFLGVAAYVRDRINPVLFQYAFGVAIQHRPDTTEVETIPIVQLFPRNFIEPSVFLDARAEGTVIKDENRQFIDIPENFTASDLEEEQRLAYFREDIGVNSHHWHWHEVYPFMGPLEVVKKDRRGELFYYMHRQIIARYNCERFCNGLAKVIPFKELKTPIHEGYFPKILSSTQNRTYAGRAANVILSDLNRTDNKVEIADVIAWASRINEAIDKGFVIDTNGTQIPLDPIKGIDILGEIVESSIISINPKFYGSLHNNGHGLIAFSHDPEGRHVEDIGVMGSVATAMRDPVFYRWHSYIESIFNKFKLTLPAYTDDELNFNGINVEKISCELIVPSPKKNILITYKEKSQVDIGAGMDFGPEGKVYATFTHLQNKPFQYKITVNNEKSTPSMGTCRIFLLPQTDELKKTFMYNDVRNYAIELDKFTVNLTPGQNTIIHQSIDSSVTIPFHRTFVDLSKTPTEDEQKRTFRFCACGWPQHLLLPKGTTAGLQYDLFCMISDYNDDSVVQDSDETSVCSDSYSYCGLKDKLYPDRRPMGFPFDRISTHTSLKEFVKAFDNMARQGIIIKHDL